VCVVESGNTAHPLKVECCFPLRNARVPVERNTVNIRGLRSGMLNPQTLRLDNCEVVRRNAPGDRRFITVDYLPLSSGETLTYDLASVRADGGESPSIVRQVYTCGE